MGARRDLPWQQRTAAASAAVAFTLLLGLLLIVGLRVLAPPAQPSRWPPLSAFDLRVPLPPSPPPVPTEAKAPPSPTLAPVLPTPAPAPAAQAAPPTQTILPIPAPARPPAEVSGSGVGTAPQGAGDGAAGTGGAGTGSGGGGIGQRARQLDGFITVADYPRAALKAGAEGTAGVRYTVLATGRVGDCTVVASTGSDLLDQTTCRLITRRFVFKPALDRAGHPAVETRNERFLWRKVE